MMRTTISFDESTANMLISHTGKTNYAAAAKQAINEYLRIKSKQKLLQLRGSVDIEDNWAELRLMEKENVH